MKLSQASALIILALLFNMISWKKQKQTLNKEEKVTAFEHTGSLIFNVFLHKVTLFQLSGVSPILRFV